MRSRIKNRVLNTLRAACGSEEAATSISLAVDLVDLIRKSTKKSYTTHVHDIAKESKESFLHC